MIHLSNYLFYIVPIASAVVFLASLTIFFQPAGERYLKYFSFFLFINLLFDIATNYTARYSIYNAFLNNMDTVLVISLELYLLRQIIAGRRAKRSFYISVCSTPWSRFSISSSSNVSGISIP